MPRESHRFNHGIEGFLHHRFREDFSFQNIPRRRTAKNLSGLQRQPGFGKIDLLGMLDERESLPYGEPYFLRILSVRVHRGSGQVDPCSGQQSGAIANPSGIGRIEDTNRL